MDQLYLIEVLVDKIKFASSGEEVPQKNEFTILVTFGNMANMEIEPEGLRKEYVEKIDPFKRDVTIDSGKSYLFPSKAENLLKAMNQSPLDVSLNKQIDQTLIGRVTIPWAWEFTDMVDRSRFNPDNLQPANVKEVYKISDDNGKIVGEMDLYVRLSCLGPNIQTQFQVVERKPILKETPPKKFLFKSSNAEATFQAQKYGEEGKSSEMLPVSPLYNPSDPEWLPTAPLSPEEMTAEKINEILCKNRDCPGVQKFKEFGLGPAATGKGLGTLYGPTDIPISYGLSHTYGSLENYGPYGIYTRPKCLEEPFIPKEPITCSNSSGCEACRCDRDSETSSQQSVCQCSAPLTMSRAAPNEDVTCGNAQNDTCCCSEPLRLNGGGEDENKVPEPMVMCKDLMQSFDKVLNEYKKALGPCGQVTCPFAPNVAGESCKQLCQKAERRSSSPGATENSINDGLVSACGTPSCPYSRKPESSTDKAFKQKQLKSACGSPTCPFTKQKLGTATDEEIMEMNLMDGPSVARSCGSPKCPFPLQPSLPPLEPIHWDCPDPLPKGPCRNPQCPLKPPELRYNLVPKGPCGSSQCPYATPPYCGDASCPFGPPQPCPYAAPPQCPPSPCPPSSCVSGCGGPCGMPPCPPPPSCYPPPCPPPSCYPPPCSPPPCGMPPCAPPPPCCCVCGNPGCPSNPPTCGDPYCPLNPAPLPCPGRAPPPCSPPPCRPPPPPPPCGGPTCPFSPPSPCSNPTCPFAPSSSPCSDPECPFASPPPAPSSPCGSPSCPYGATPTSPCGDANCPFAPPPAPTSNCGNPDCPFVVKKESPCFIPPTSGNTICANPACPYAEKKPSNDVCNNPECPYATQKSTTCYISPNNSVCSNPNCPDASPKGSVCNNPQCPYANPCKMQIGGTKVSVEFGPYGIRKDTITQHVTEYDGPVEYTSGDRLPNADLQPCSPRTCMAGDGNLECAECRAEANGENYPIDDDGAFNADKGQTSISAPVIGEGSPKTTPPKGLKRNSTSEKVISKTKGAKNGKGGKKQKSKFVYKMGDLYPGVNIGHRECIIPGRNVPAKMGWLWNVHVPCVGLKPRLGWRPGAVGRTIARRIIAHRKAKGLKLLEPLTPKASKKKLRSKYSEYESDSDVTVAPKPTLQIKKREGCYYITMNPLKDPKTIEDNENPYMDCTPLQFKITKKPTPEEELKTCFCDGEEEKSSDSELDIEFTPPAGVIRPERLKRKKNVVHTDTQYNPEDFATKAKGKGKDNKGKGGKGKGKGKGGKKGKKK